MNPIVIAPTTIMNTAPAEYIEIAARAGFDGIGLRLYASPGMPFFPVVGDTEAETRLRAVAKDAGVPVLEIFTCYLTEDMDFEAMRRAHEFGAELGAKWALVIGDDDNWDRMVQNFGTLCDNAGQFGLTCTLEAPVNRRKLTNLELNLKLIEDAGRDNAGLSVDPVQFCRAGNTFAQLKDLDPKLLPYTQICDTTSLELGVPYCMPGEGVIPLKEMLDIMPEGLPLSLEYHFRDQPGFTPETWAKHVLDGTRAYVERYIADKKGS
jgi:sugar phosphate isomerase/epimerase